MQDSRKSRSFFRPSKRGDFYPKYFGDTGILDTLRIIVIRLSNGQKPWVADRNHMHHLLLDKGLSHKQATFCLGKLQVIAILGYIGVNNLGPIAQHLFVLCLYSTYAVMFFSASVTRKLGENGKGFQKLSSVLRTLLP